ncbi:MAG TPA: methyltransferase domain-containing protein [Euryarchaeota archaeon]|nr:methyltransferase domain-containing protein [Euryarchaeota archaeon]
MEGLYELEDFSYMESEGVYPVERDSLLLFRAFCSVIDGKRNIIDMGCGTGILTLKAARSGLEVVSIDREPRALASLRANLDKNGLSSSIFLSDLFEGVPNSFRNWADLAAFNPPYLEGELKTGYRRRELALLGGIDPAAISRRFLRDVRNYLSEKGLVLIIVDRKWKTELLDPDGYYGEKVVIESADMEGEILDAVLMKPRNGK